MEQIFHHRTVEQARNAAIQWLEERGVIFGPRRDIVPGKFGVLEGSEAGVRSEEGAKPFWRLRLDFDPAQGAHYNVEHGTGAAGEKAAFRFEGSEALVAKLARGRAPR
jgi:hypothetical protein